MITAERYHDISCGHRVVGHEGKCQFLHGHNYRVTFVCAADALDVQGRVLDFSAIKTALCMWLEDNWDHKFLAWDKDQFLGKLAFFADSEPALSRLRHSFVWVPFNPTAENMAAYLLHTVGPRQLQGTNVRVIEVRVEETRKCSATATIND